ACSPASRLSSCCPSQTTAPPPPAAQTAQKPSPQSLSPPSGSKSHANPAKHPTAPPETPPIASSSSPPEFLNFAFLLLPFSWCYQHNVLYMQHTRCAMI